MQGRIYHSHNLRKGRWSEAGRIYLVTTVTTARQPVFRSFYIARSLINVLRKEEDLVTAQTLAFVVMPDHLHWLLSLREGSSLSTVVGRVKSVFSHQYGKAVWQSGFYDHAVRREEDLKALARYVVANPLRANLVSQLGDYPHWDAIWL